MPLCPDAVVDGSETIALALVNPLRATLGMSNTATVTNRPGVQGPRTITLVLDGASGGGTLGAQTTATLWILDAN